MIKHSELAAPLRRWVGDLRSGSTRMFVLEALHRTKVFEILRTSGPATSAELAERAGIDAHLLDGVLNYIAFADQIIAKSGERFELTPVGHEWLFGDIFAAAVDGHTAYACLQTQLLPALRGQVRYGKDFVRDGESLARASHVFSRATHSWIVAEMRKLNTSCVVDLGCGAAQLLNSVLKLDERLTGVGIDIDPGCLREAEQSVASAGNAQRVSLYEGDLQKPESFAGKITQRPVALTAVAVLHEFLRDGRDQMVAFFRKYKELFAGSYFFIGEFDRATDEDFKRGIDDGGVALLYQHFIHPLSLQGLPMPRAEWVQLFEQAGIELVKVSPRLGPRLLVYLLRM